MAISLRALKIAAPRINMIAARYGVTRIRVFGSVARGTWEPESDIDLLIALEPGRSLLDMIGFKQDVEVELGTRVDVVSERGVHELLAPEIFAEAVSL